MVVENSRPSAEALSSDSKIDSGGTLSDAALLPARRQVTAERLAARLHIFVLGRAFGRLQVFEVIHLLVGERQLEAVAERLERGRAHLFLLVGDVLRLARLAHAIALHGLGQDHRRLALVVHRRVIRRVHLVRVVAAAVQAPDVVIRPARHHLLHLRVLAEEVLTHVRAVACLEGLVVAVHALVHALAQQAETVARQQRIPVTAPDHLEHVPARAAEGGFQFLDDLAVAAHRTVEALQVAVDHENKIIEILARGEPDGAEGLGFVHLAVADEAPYLAVLGIGDAAVVQIFHEARLVDGHDRPQAHGHGRELPEVRHQPRMRIRRQPLAVDLAAEMVHLFFGQAPEHECTRVDAGRGMALHVYHVAAVVFGGRVPEVVEADVVQGRGRGEARDVAAEVGIALVGAQHHRERVPAHVGTDAVFKRVIARRAHLLVGRDGVYIGGIGRIRHVHAGGARQLDLLLDQVMRAFRPLLLDDRAQRVEPLLGLLGVGIGLHR